jgi:CheY-like chemotaxis protein
LREQKMDQRERRILVIDDDETVLRVISDLVTFLGYDVKTTPEGLDGIELLQQEPFDLVIVDMIMPQIGGLALSKVIRQQHPQIPILAISGHYEKLIGTVQRPDVDAILPKPMTLEILKTTLKDVFSQKDA